MRVIPTEASPVYKFSFGVTLFLLAAGALLGVIDSVREGSIPPGIRINRLESADRLFAEGRFEEAAAEYRTAAAVMPGDFEAWSKLGSCMDRLGRAEESLAAYRQAWAVRPRNPQTNNNYGIALVRAGRLDEAEERYRRAIALDPAQLDARINLGALMLRRGRPDEARKLFTEAIEADPSYAPARGAMGATEAGAGNFVAAEAHFAEAARLDPSVASYARDLQRVRAEIRTRAGGADREPEAEGAGRPE